jgi:hypothetical protein
MTWDAVLRRMMAGLLVVVPITAAFAAAGTVPAGASAAARSAEDEPACGAWTLVASPNVGSDPSILNAVAATSPSRAYAVGDWYQADTGVYHTLIERWNGSTWKRVASPDPGDTTNALQGVAASEPGDAWAVGFTVNAGSGFETLTEHLKAGAWSVVPSPSPGDGESVLWSVAPVSADDVWAVGYQQASGAPRRTLIEHWNGSVWKVVPSPSRGADDNFLYGVTALGHNDVWAVGVYSAPWFQTLVLHWNGSTWKVVKSPNVGDGNNFLYDIAATGAPGQLRSVGSSLTDTGTATLAMRWNGSRWKATPSPSPGDGFDELFGIATGAADDLWAVGDQGGTSGPFQTLAEHWDGAAWTLVSTPNRGPLANHLYDVAHVPGTDSWWAVGMSLDVGVGERTLIESYC